MSESENPQPNPPPSDRPPRPAPGGGQPRRPFGPRRDRPSAKAPERPAALDDLSTRGPNLRDLNAQIQNELDAALAGFSDADMLASAAVPPAKAGAPGAPAEPGRKRGRVISIHGDDVFVEIPGGRGQGVLALMQFEGNTPAIGSEVDVAIEGYDGANGLLLLTRLGAVQYVDWSSVTPGMIVEARVTATNKGGLSVEVNGIRGFMPISQIDLYRVEQPEQYVNQKLRCVVSEVNPQEKNLVVSRRAMLERERDEQKEKFWTAIEVGQVRDGIVRSIRDFGAFVDLGGADGLVPVSELAWTRVENPADVVKEGQAVKVKVMKLDRDARRISLSLKQLAASPWDDIERRVIPDSIINGKVTRTADFGAFVEIEPGIEGLIHISELAPHRVRKATAIVSVGQVVPVKVLAIDKEARRISLSLKAATTPPEPDEDENDEAVGEVKPRVRTFPLRGGVGGEIFPRPPE